MTLKLEATVGDAKINTGQVITYKHEILISTFMHKSFVHGFCQAKISCTAANDCRRKLVGI